MTLEPEETTAVSGNDSHTSRITGTIRDKWQLWVVGGGVIVLAVLVGSWWIGRGEEDSSVVNGELTHTVKRGDMRVSFTERGNVKAASSMEVFSEVEGRATIVSIVPEGTTVQKGDILVELDSKELEQDLNQQQITVETAEAAVLQATEQLEIQKSLNASSMDQAELDLKLAQIDLEKYTGEKGMEQRNWNAIAMLWGQEELLADVTGRTRTEIETAMEKAMHTVVNARGGARPSAEDPAGEGVDDSIVAEAPSPHEGGGNGGADVEGTPQAPAGAEDLVPESGLAPTGLTQDGEESGDPDPDGTPSMADEYTDDPEEPETEDEDTPRSEPRMGDFLLAYKKALADVKIASAEVARAKNQKEWTERLAEKGYVTGTELIADTLSLQKAELNEQQAKGALELFLTYTWRKEYATYKSAVDQAEAALGRAEKKARSELAQAEAELRAKESTYSLYKKRLEKIQDQLQKTRIEAPQNGMVVYEQEGRRGRETVLEAGAEVYENQHLINLPDLSKMAVEVDIHESWIDQVHEGLPALVTIDALPDLQLRAKVTKVGILPDHVNRWLNPDLKVYETDVTIDDSPEVKMLRPGMSAKVEVVIDLLRNVIKVPVQSVTTVDRQQVCYVLDGSDFEPVPVVTGQYNESFIEIVSGLEEGDVIQLNAPPPAGTADLDEPEEDLEIPEADEGPMPPGRAGPEGRDRRREGGPGGEMRKAPGPGDGGLGTRREFPNAKGASGKRSFERPRGEAGREKAGARRPGRSGAAGAGREGPSSRGRPGAAGRSPAGDSASRAAGETKASATE